MAANQTDARTSLAERRRRRTEQIVSATRALFDKRGIRDAQVEDIAKAVGINRAIIYRHFRGKEELFATVLSGYLDELAGLIAEADRGADGPVERLTAITGCFFDFGVAHPAFADCALSLMRRTGPELLEEVRPDPMQRLGGSIAACLGRVAQVLRDGTELGVFQVEDPDVLANALYAQGLGLLSLARVGLLVTEEVPSEPGVPVPGVATVPAAELRETMVATAVALASR